MRVYVAAALSAVACRERVSDMFDSPQRSEDYRDMYDYSAEGTRPQAGIATVPGLPGRPRAASRSTRRPSGVRRPPSLDY